MKEVRDFLATLAKAGKSCKEIKPLVDAAYRDKALIIIQINGIIKAVKEGKISSDHHHCNAKKTKKNDNIVAAVAAAIKKDWRRTVRELATMLGLTYGTIQSNLSEDLGLAMKSTHWVPKLLSTAQKEERVKHSSKFL
jgi:hypothetical protein